VENLGTAQATVIGIHEAWFEVALTDDWTAAYRVVPQDGAPVIAEVRVFPRESGWRMAGEWSGVYLGLHATVPRGGITARLLRQVRFSNAAGSKLAQGRAAWRRYLKLSPAAKQAFARAGFRQMKRRRVVAPTKNPRAWSDDLVLHAAALYVERLSVGSRRPNVDVAATLKLKPTQVRDLLHTARKRDWLTAGTQGIGRGALTERARSLLAERSRT